MSAAGATRRRAVLIASAGVLGGVWVRPAGATAQELAAAIQAFANGGAVRAGRVVLEIAPLVENGNAVPVTVKVDSPMTASDHVAAIGIFNEKNPQRDVAVFHLGPRAGKATVATRIRLATSQQLVAVARMSDGSCWTHAVDVIVTLAACVES